MARLDEFGARRVSVGIGTGYTVFVRLLKVLLPLSALVIVGVVFARLSTSPLREVEIAARSKNDKTAAGQIEVVGARYEGADDEGRPYTLIAGSARRAHADPAQGAELAEDTVLLDDLKADIVLGDESWLAMSARTGAYAAATQRLDLSGDVALYHDSGYEMHMDRLAVDMKTRHAVSKTPVRAQGPMGGIEAKGLEVQDAGDRIVFAGPVTLTLYHLGRKG